MSLITKSGDGFTIVETLIFLAVSGLMFALAISAMSGKTQTTEFQTSLTNFRSDLNQIMTNVADGNYPEQSTDGSFVNCSSTGPTPSPPISFNYYATQQKAVPDGSCQAIGEIIEFGENASNQQVYWTIPVFGCSYQSCDITKNSSMTLADAFPYATPNVFNTNTMPFGLTITLNGGNPNIGAFGIFNFSSNSGENSNGSEHVELFQIPNWKLQFVPNVEATSPNGLISAINTLPGGTIQLTDNCPSPITEPGNICLGTAVNPPSAPINPTAGLSFCLLSGTTNNHSALFTLGGSSSSTNVSYTIKNTGDCT
jgi:type II secretory pathway pseudopilin PulG